MVGCEQSYYTYLVMESKILSVRKGEFLVYLGLFLKFSVSYFTAIQFLAQTEES